MRINIRVVTLIWMTSSLHKVVWIFEPVCLNFLASTPYEDSNPKFPEAEKVNDIALW